MAEEKTTALRESEEKTTALGVVLAGGAGSRLGGGKATVELAGRALVEWPLAALAAAGIEAMVVAKLDTALPALAVPVLREADEPRHPLLGIVTGLRAAAGRPILAVACDLPLLTPPLLAALAAAPQRLALAAPGGDPQPLLGRYAPELLPELEAALGREEPLRRTVAALSPRLLADPDLARFGDPAELLLNVNDGADLARAGDILERG
ncbi:MAG: molybdenum cofactor guanylyltransferase [Solirubrobacterales bacterium]